MVRLADPRARVLYVHALLDGMRKGIITISDHANSGRKRPDSLTFFETRLITYFKQSDTEYGDRRYAWPAPAIRRFGSDLPPGGLQHRSDAIRGSSRKLYP